MKVKTPSRKSIFSSLDTNSVIAIILYMLLSLEKLNILSEISRDIGQILFASVFIEPITKGSTDLKILFLGLILSLSAWSLSLLLTK